MVASLRSAASAPPRRALLGREQPRIFTPPLRRLTATTSRGFEAIAFAEDVLGLVLHPWQKWALIHGLELLEDGTFRFRTLLVLVGRQNGKTTLMLVIALWRMYVDRAPLVIGTAQNLDVAEEAWQGAVEMAEGVPELADEIEHVDRTNGKKQLRLETGERYKVAAASRRGGRGLSGDLVMLDELREHRTWEAWAAVTKTTMARALAQILGFSNAGDRGSVVLADLRRKALAFIARDRGEPVDGVRPDDVVDGADDSLGIFDWSAEPGCAIDDPNGWEQGNPSLGYPNGITERAIRSALGTDPEPVFRTEVLCQWVDQLTPGVIPEAAWDACRDLTVQMAGCQFIGLDVSPLQSAASIAVAAFDTSGAISVRLAHTRAGVMWLADRLLAGCAETGSQVTIVKGSAAESVREDLEKAGVPFAEPISAQDYAMACGELLAGVTSGRIRHRGQPDLDEAVTGATSRSIGDRWVFDRKRPSANITPIVAVAVAAFAAAHHTAPTEPQIRIVG